MIFLILISSAIKLQLRLKGRIQKNAEKYRTTSPGRESAKMGKIIKKLLTAD
jgi:hypothetical protein